MAENLASEVVLDVPAGDVKCRKEVGVVDGAASSGETPKQQVNHGVENVSKEGRDHLVQGKKKRRRKTKRKTPYNKMSLDNRNRSKKTMRGPSQKRLARYKQPEAPYNSNRFLIEDHNDLKDFDVDLMAAANRVSGDGNINKAEQKTPERGRVRDCSFTSVESEEDYFYSSPEDEEEFLTKEFSNTYKDLHVEALANLSKSELIQHILFLEEKMDSTQKKLESLTQTKNEPPNGANNMSERLAYFQEEISKLAIANKTLLNENEELRRQKRSAASSEDSESDSSSSTCSSSSSSCSEMSDNECQRSESTSPRVNGEVLSETTDLNLMDTENAT